MPTRTIETKFYTITQNNSGGYFDHKPELGIGYGICVEAVSANEARRRLKDITESYFYSECACCGERWSIWIWDEDGTEEPTKYGKPLKGGWGIPSYIHYLDGRIEAREPEPRS